MGDAVVGVADDQLAQLTRRGVTVGEAAGLVEGPAADWSRPVREIDLPVTVAVVPDADEGVGGG